MKVEHLRRGGFCGFFRVPTGDLPTTAICPPQGESPSFLLGTFDRHKTNPLRNILFPKTSIKEYLVLRPCFIIIPDSSNINYPPRGTLWHASMSFAVTFALILLKSSTKICYGPCWPMAPVGHHGEIIGLWPPSATMGFYFHLKEKIFYFYF